MNFDRDEIENPIANQKRNKWKDKKSNNFVNFFGP